MRVGTALILAVVVVVVVVVAAVTGFVAFDLGHHLTLEALRDYVSVLAAWHGQHPLLTTGAFFALYVAITALSLPGATIMTIAAGALFGLAAGTVVASFASTTGATLAFLASRWVLRPAVQRRFRGSLQRINEGVERDGAYYLLGLRLVPAIPFLVVNLLMGLTPMRTLTFFVVSQVGMLAGTIVYVNAGTQLASIDSLGGLLSPGLIASMVALAIFALIARKAAQSLQVRRQRWC